MVIITGVGRCGTSVVARFIKEMGFNIGTVQYYPNIRAGYEDAHTQVLNTIASNLYDLGSMTEVEEYKLVDAIRQNCCFNAVKDPRFTWHPKIIGLWQKAFPDIKVFLLTRNFSDASRSRAAIQSKYTKGWPDRSVTEEDLRTDYMKFFLELYNLRISYILLTYPFFLENYDYLFYDLVLNF